MIINKSANHECFFVFGCRLYECCVQLINTNEWYIDTFIHEILWPDTDKLTDDEMVTINKILNGECN